MSAVQAMPDGRRPCRIVLTEDDEPVRDRLAAMLDDWRGGELVAVCATVAESLAAIEAQPFDLLITDLRLPDGDGLDAIRLLRRRQPAAEAMVISVLADERTVLDAIEAGASGYLLKDADPTGLVEAISGLMDGRSPISSRIARLLAGRIEARAQTAQSLDARELDILRQIARGFTNAEIADHLGISSQAVPMEVRNIYRKLEKPTR